MLIKKGQKFNKLTAIKFSHKVKYTKHWLFKCECGNKKVFCVGNIKNGHTKSCGCYNKEKLSERKIHGMCKTKTYMSWSALKNRCLNSNNPHFKNWGGRGIMVCKEWMKFENFYRDMGEIPENKSIDRIDNNGNYCKENCCWSSPKQQQNNRRNNCLLTYQNKTKTVKQWSEELEINVKTIYARIKKGWSVERTLTKKFIAVKF